MTAVRRHAVRWILLLVWLVSLAEPVHAQSSTARALFQTAQAGEREARAALAVPDARPGPTLRTVRSAISAYRRVVRRFPRSGYCDDALWRAAGLATDAFARFGENRDRMSARELLTQLVREYPNSQMVALARRALDDAGATGTPTDLTIREIHRTAIPGRVDVSIHTAGRGLMSFTEARLEGPPRYYVDVRGPRLDPALRNRTWAVDSSLVTHVRVGQQSASVTRVVLDTPDPASCRARQLAHPPRLEIGCTAATPGSAVATTPPAATPVVVRPPLASGSMAGVLVLPAIPRGSISGASPAPVRVAPPVIPGIGTIAMTPAPAGRPAAMTSVAAPLPATPRGTMWATLPAPPAGTALIAAPPVQTLPVPAPPVPAPPAAVPQPAPPARPVVSPDTPPAPVESVAAPAPPESPLWSLPVLAEEHEAAFWLPSAGVAAAPPAPSSPRLGRAVLPLGAAYHAFVPRTILGQQPSVQVSLGAQFTTGDDARLGGLPRIEPDLGIQVFQPGLAVGNLYADVNVTRDDRGATLGRGVVRLDGFRLGGLVWSVDAGDTWNAPVVQDFGFTNLFAPPVTFQGVSASASGPRSFLVVSGGRVTAQRNIFGTDTESTGQRIYQGLFSHRASDRLDIFGHANHIDSQAMTLYTPLTDFSTDAGGGVRYRLRPELEIVVDAGLSDFRRHGADGREQTLSGIVGAMWSLPGGWLQLNAQRYPIGRFPIYNYPYVDRAGVFASGEYDLGARARVFGGIEVARTGLDPDASAGASAGIAPGDGTRAYGGMRFGVFDASLFTLRVDGGGRRIEPSKFGPGFESNTGVFSVDWHTRFPVGNAFARYERRSSVDPASDASSFTQHDLMAQAYFNVAPNRQFFGRMLMSRRADRTGEGQTLWQAGGGAQAALGPLYTRVEGTFGRSQFWTTGVVSTHRAVSAGISGQVAKGSFLSVDFYLDYTPFAGDAGNPWITRTMVRFTRLFPFGPSRMPAASVGQAQPSGPTGRVAGTVYLDWDGDGQADADEETVSGVTLAVPGAGTVVSGADGRYSLSGVPVGERRVAIDLATLPADYDPPAEPGRTVTVSRSQIATADFGMLPLGTFGGMVFQDVDGDGRLGEVDAPIDGAVLVMDDGSRTEVTRGGRFTFDPVRMGTHTVSILTESLPEGSQLSGPPTIEVVLARSQDAETVVFLVKVEKRPEIRKVFPPKKK